MIAIEISAPYSFIKSPQLTRSSLPKFREQKGRE